MKKVVYSIILVAVAGVVSLSSCKKIYHCTCSFNNQVVYTQDLGYQVLSDAQKSCNTHDSTIAGELWDCTVY